MILVGPSGCGKSTALRMIAGLEDISDGELRIGGDRVNDRAPKDRDIAMVFQNYALYPHMTVARNMGFALELAGVDKSEIDKQGQRGGRDPRPRRPPRPQAGQPVRRPAPARRDGPRDRARPEGVPDGRAAVEPRRQAARADAHGDLAAAAQLGTTTVYVTHDQTEAMTLGDRVAVMRAGELQQVGTPKELYDNPVNLFVAGFIGSPSMNFLPGEIERRQASSCRSARSPLPAGRPAHGQGRRRPAPGGLRGRRALVRQAGHQLQGQDRRARVDGLRVLRVLRGRVRAGRPPSSSTSSPPTPAPRTSRRDANQVVARLDADSKRQAGRGGRAVLRVRQAAPVRPRVGRLPAQVALRRPCAA